MIIFFRSTDCFLLTEDQKIQHQFSLNDGWFDELFILEEFFEKLDELDWQDTQKINIIFDEPWVTIKTKKLPKLSKKKTKQMIADNFADEYFHQMEEMQIHLVSNNTASGQKHHLIYTIRDQVINLIQHYFSDQNISEIQCHFYHNMLYHHAIRNHLNADDTLILYISDDSALLLQFQDGLLQQSLRIFNKDRADVEAYLKKIDQKIKFLQFNHNETLSVNLINDDPNLINYFEENDQKSPIDTIKSDIDYHTIQSLFDEEGQTDQKLIDLRLNKTTFFDVFFKEPKYLIATAVLVVLINVFLFTGWNLQIKQKENDLNLLQSTLNKLSALYLPEIKQADNVAALIERKYKSELAQWGDQQVTKKRDYIISELFLIFNSMKINSQAQLDSFTYDQKSGIVLTGVVKSIDALEKAQEVLATKLIDYQVQQDYELIDLNVHFRFTIAPQ